ncbi:hypothetical protein GJV76_10930 [Myroides sp. BIT-d1]|uniref:Lipocalin-like domain-containing protein n=1 Tax=Myroides albus TaxID=2562892 RepID=A0A6I3LLB5_9FLAO|nr:hypothetical protein [Myroides albus]MTG98634.1 hypothetical protein [Myroides albus]
MIKRIFMLTMVLFMVVSCSSDDSNSSGNAQGTEQGISKSKQIKTPEWLHGDWVHKNNGEYNYSGFRIKPDDFCVFFIGGAMCYKQMIEQTIKVDDSVFEVQQVYKSDYYKLSISAMGVETLYEFKRISEDEVEFIFGGLRPVMVKK